MGPKSGYIEQLVLGFLLLSAWVLKTHIWPCLGQRAFKLIGNFFLLAGIQDKQIRIRVKSDY